MLGRSPDLGGLEMYSAVLPLATAVAAATWAFFICRGSWRDSSPAELQTFLDQPREIDGVEDGVAPPVRGELAAIHSSTGQSDVRFATITHAVRAEPRASTYAGTRAAQPHPRDAHAERA